MSMFAKVRRLIHRDHLTISEIQRRTSLSCNTIKAWLKEGNPDNYTSRGHICGFWEELKFWVKDVP